MDIDFIKEMYNTYKLDRTDLFKHPSFGFVIITRSGVEKIAATENIDITYEVISTDLSNVVVKAIATKGDKRIETFGEASPKNNKNSYPWAISEKRALSRSVLKMIGAYQRGVFSEDESDDFKVSKANRQAVT